MMSVFKKIGLVVLVAGLSTSVGFAQKSTSKSSGSSKSAQKAHQTQSKPSAASQVINPTGLNAELIARQIFDGTNQERLRAGLSTLSWNQALAVAATGHSADMAKRNYFSHKSKGLFKKSDLRDRTTKAGHIGGMVAENIAMLPTFRSQRYGTYMGADGRQQRWMDQDNCTYEQLSASAMEQWMNSPGHRANILHPQLRSLGVGVAVGNKDGVPYVYLTQNFAGN